MPVYQSSAGQHSNNMNCPIQINLQHEFNMPNCFHLNVALEVVSTV